ncbi:phage holin family protein [Erythrobacter crassostreae]|uniref:Phage holin family protein n=1 Tax=Erythrobacter crassostreae TaxID=2828328 RepID=A0A9X1F600_9SPHN|nr:phage holin family protein [Erythrobacter crassostrea]MBV7259923.1 phage holin family protein [Erythrobacter crassostrea]
MRDDERQTGEDHDGPDPTASDDADTASGNSYDESLTEEIAALIDDGRTYAEAEFAFQKTRAAIAGKSVGFAIAYVVVAIITLHIAVLALAVGMVMALAPLVTIWGAIAIVVGVLLLATVLLGLAAKGHAGRLGMMFGSSGKEDGA